MVDKYLILMCAVNVYCVGVVCSTLKQNRMYGIKRISQNAEKYVKRGKYL